MPNFCINFLNKAAKLLSISYDFAVASSSDAWIKTESNSFSCKQFESHPPRMRGLKHLNHLLCFGDYMSHPPRMRGLKHTIREGIISLCLRGRQRSSLSRILPIKQIFCRAGIYRRANFDCKLCKYNDDEKTICSEDCSDALIDGLIEIVKGGGVE